MIWFSKTIQYRIWPPRPSLEYLLNYKIFSGFPSLDKTAKDLTGPVSQQLVPDSFFPLGAIQTNYHIFQGSSISKLSILGDKTKPFLKGNLHKYREKKNIHSFWQVEYFKWRRYLSSTLFFFTANWTQTAGFVTVLNPLSSLYEISRRFEFHNLWRAWNRQHWLFIIWHFSLFTLMMELQFREVVSL